MKHFFTILTITIFLSGCATKNAFIKLEVTDLQEIAIENTVSGKIVAGEKVGGIFSAMYLNNIYPSLSKSSNIFYISVFLKNKSEDLNITSNTNKPLRIKELPHANKFNHLLPIKNEWTTDYLVTFKNVKSDNITLSIESGQFSSGLLNYTRD